MDLVFISPCCLHLLWILQNFVILMTKCDDCGVWKQRLQWRWNCKFYAEYLILIQRSVILWFGHIIPVNHLQIYHITYLLLLIQMVEWKFISLFSIGFLDWNIQWMLNHMGTQRNMLSPTNVIKRTYPSTLRELEEEVKLHLPKRAAFKVE